MKKMIKN